MITHALQLAAKRYLAVAVGAVAAGDLASTEFGLPQTVSDGGTGNVTDDDQVPVAGGRALFFLVGEDNDPATMPSITCACSDGQQPDGDLTGNQIVELVVTIHYPSDRMVDPAAPEAGTIDVAAIAAACRTAVQEALYLDTLPDELNAAREDAAALTVQGLISRSDRRFNTERGRASEFILSLYCAAQDLTA